MEQKLLKKHKLASKRLLHVPAYKPLRRGRLPRPLEKMGGGRMFATDLLSVGESYRLCFAWRDGVLLADTAFFAWLFEAGNEGLYPLAILHYHPSHKPVHMLTPCRDGRDFLNRQLPGVIEFKIAKERFDPRQDTDRQRMAAIFCERCGIAMGQAGGLLL